MWQRVLLRVGVLALAALAPLLLIAYLREHQARKAADKEVAYYTDKWLKERNFTPLPTKPPTFEVTPGVTPIIQITGGVEYHGTNPSNDSPVGTVVDTHGNSGNPQHSPCDLGELFVRVDCDTRAVVANGKTYSQLITSGIVRGFGQQRTLPPTVAKEIEGSAASVVSRPSVPSWAVYVLVGGQWGAQPQAVLGGHLALPGRWGVWATAGTDGGRQSYGVGVSYRLH